MKHPDIEQICFDALELAGHEIDFMTEDEVNDLIRTDAIVWRHIKQLVIQAHHDEMSSRLNGEIR
ncbi:hypothetical protein ACET9H_20910 [Aeromonas media]|uniref:hypothetical protein n=1 Tax=Aeromonas media TaxID=651 RepID=UPI0038D1E148